MISPTCLDDPVCAWFADQTGLSWADAGYFAVITPLRIVLIIVAALVLRGIAHRLIRRMVARVTAKPDKRETPARDADARRKRLALPVVPELTLRTERRRQRAEALGSVLRSGASVILFVVASMLVLSELGVNLAPLLASAGIVGVAFGLGAQSLVRDFLSGLLMLLEDQYGVGDVVDLGGASGTVEEIGLRVTTLRDEAGVVWYVRNGEIVRVGNRSQRADTAPAEAGTMEP